MYQPKSRDKFVNGARARESSEIEGDALEGPKKF